MSPTTYIRAFRLFRQYFYEPLLEKGLLTKEERFQAFPNLLAMLDMHRVFNKALEETKEKDGYIVKAIGGILLSRVSGRARQAMVGAPEFSIFNPVRPAVAVSQSWTSEGFFPDFGFVLFGKQTRTKNNK